MYIYYLYDNQIYRYITITQMCECCRLFISQHTKTIFQ